MSHYAPTDEQTKSWTEHSGSLLQPDVVLPAQFFLNVHGKTVDGGERRLILAILEDAVACFQKYLFARDNKGRRLFREAEGWMMTRDKQSPYSFENICEFLSLDADHLRQGLRRWARAAAARAGSAELRNTPARHAGGMARAHSAGLV